MTRPHYQQRLSAVDAHGLKIKGGGAQILAKIPGGSRLFGENCQGGPLFWVLLHFYKNFFKNLP
jgi:hypothetical protein